jgi:hypothetical protein
MRSTLLNKKAESRFLSGKKLFLFLYFTFYFFNFAFSQNPLVKQWDYRFGGNDYDDLYSFRQTADGGYILGGFSYSPISGDKTQNNWNMYADYWIVKVDSLGIKQWDKRFGGTDWDYLYSLQQTADGGYILGGFSYSGIGGDKTQTNWNMSVHSPDFWIVKTDSLGNKQWDKDFGGTGFDCLFSLQQTADGGYILGGWSNSGISGDKTQPNRDTTLYTTDYWIVKTDSLGNKQWDKTFGGTKQDKFHSLQQTAYGGYILGGYSVSDSSGDKTQPNWDTCITCAYRGDYWIVKTDSLGNKQWDKDFGGSDLDQLVSLRQTADGGFILGGISSSGISGDKTQPNWDTCTNCFRGDYWIVKIDSLGAKQWDKDFGGINAEYDFGIVSQTVDGGYLLAGSSYSDISGNKTEDNLGDEQTWVLKTDSSGNKQWDKTLHTDSNLSIGELEICFAIQTKDGCYAMANYTNAGIGGDKTQASRGGFDYWIIKFCDTTSTTSITQLPNPQSTFSIYPNPSNGSFQVTGLKFPVERIEIFNLLGETVFSKQPETNNPKLETNLPNGIYIIKAYTEKGVFQQKLAINH